MYDQEPMDRRPVVNDSILITIKKLLGYDIAYPAFDADIILLINSNLMRLRQLGVEIPRGFTVTGDQETWEDLIGPTKRLEAIKTYLYIRVRLVHDTPASSTVLQALKDEAAEIEWRLNHEVDEAFKPKRGGDCHVCDRTDYR